MTKNLLSIILSILILLFSSIGKSKIVDKIVAVVNGEIITMYDLKKEIKASNINKLTNISFDKNLIFFSILYIREPLANSKK